MVTHSSGGWSGGPLATICLFSAFRQMLETSCAKISAGRSALSACSAESRESVDEEDEADEDEEDRVL